MKALPFALGVGGKTAVAVGASISKLPEIFRVISARFSAVLVRRKSMDRHRHYVD